MKEYKYKFEDHEKKKIWADWLSVFPVLSRYTESKFYCVYGPLLMGLRIECRRGSYNVLFECYPLWEELNPKRPVFLYYINKRNRVRKRSWLYKLFHLFSKKCIWGNPIDYNFREHNYYFQSAAEWARIQVGDILKENVPANVFIEKIKELGSSLTSLDYGKIGFYVANLALAYYLDDRNLIEKTKLDLEEVCKPWDMKFFESGHNYSIEKRQKDLYAKFENRTVFMNQIKQNKVKKEFKKLKEIRITSPSLEII